MSRFPILFIAALLLNAADPQQKPLFKGKWQLQADKCEFKALKASEAQLVVGHEVQGEIRVEESMKLADGTAKARDFKCNTFGKDCEYTEGTVNGKMSIYYLGPKLVAIERLGKGDEIVTKRTYSLSEDGSSLTVEILQMVPERAGADKLVFTKQ